LKILYVEDEALIALDGKSMLEDLGFGTIKSVQNLDEANAAVESQDFDAALLDVNLGDGTTSLDLAKKLIDDGVPVVFASGYNSSENVIGTLDAPLVAKPFSTPVLKRAITKAFAQQQQ